MNTHPHQGFTLIEVLIAVVIFGVGLLAVASLQGVARKASYEAVQRTTATHLAESLLERMRANPRGLEAYVGSALSIEYTEGSEPTGDPTACFATVCTDPAVMGAADLAQWWQLLVGATETVDDVAVGGLVQPTVCVRSSSAGVTGSYEVAIAWRGAAEIEQDGSDPCGRGDARYGACGAPGTEAECFRRVVVVDSYFNAL